MRTAFLSIALISLLLQAESCQKKQESKAQTTSPTPVAVPTKSAGPKRTTDAPLTSISNKSLLQQGIWSGTGVTLQITASGAEVEFDCAHGTIDEHFQTKSDGSFEVGGTFVPEGGPVRVPVDGVPQEKKLSATYRGRIEGDKMTLEVTVPETGANLTGLSLVRGQPARLRKCY